MSFARQLAFIVLPATLLVAAARAEVVDRIVATAGRSIVTLSDVEQEQRMVCFLNGGPPSLSDPARIRDLASKLVDRLLIRREMEGGVFPSSPKSETDASMRATRQRFATDDAYRAAQERCGISEVELVRYLELQNQVLDFIDFRVRPGLQISSEQIRAYYDEQLMPAWTKNNEAVQPLEAVREQIVALLTEREVNVRLDAWMQDLRAQAEIRLR
jgi:hypothetical protein